MSISTTLNTQLNRMFNGGRIVIGGKSAEYLANAVYSHLGKAPTQRVGFRKNTVTQTKMKAKSKTTSKKNRKVATVGTVKRLLRGSMETKQLASSVTNTTVAPNTIYTFNPTAQIVQGTIDGGRVGDSINLRSFECQFRFITDKRAAFYQYRVMVVWSGEEFNPSASVFSAGGLGSSELFVAGTFSGYATAPTNSKSITVLYDHVYAVNSMIDDFNDGVIVRARIPLKGIKYNYQANGAPYGKNKNLYVIVIPDWYSTNGTTPTTAGGIFMNYCIKFTDA